MSSSRCSLSGFSFCEVQGYLSHKKQRPSSALQWDYAYGPMVVLGEGAVSYEQGTPFGAVLLLMSKVTLQAQLGNGVGTLISCSWRSAGAIVSIFVPATSQASGSTWG